MGSLIPDAVLLAALRAIHDPVAVAKQFGEENRIFYIWRLAKQNDLLPPVTRAVENATPAAASATALAELKAVRASDDRQIRAKERRQAIAEAYKNNPDLDKRKLAARLGMAYSMVAVYIAQIKAQKDLTVAEDTRRLMPLARGPTASTRNFSNRSEVAP